MQPIGIVEYRKKERLNLRWNWLQRWHNKPRIESLFAIEDEGPVCYRLLCPSISETNPQEYVWQMARDYCQSLEIGSLAWPWFNGLPDPYNWGLPIFTGWYFTAALALVLAGERIKRGKVHRLYVAGYTPLIPEIIDQLSRWYCPVLWSSPFPAQCEVILHKLYYERGCRAAVTAFQPLNWETDDLVLAFNQPLVQLAAASRAQVIDLSPEARGFFPLLEDSLTAQGVDCRLGYLGPIMEAFVNEGQVLSLNPRDSIIETLRGGAATGCWELFLDNGASGNYNSLKGLAGYQG